MTEQGARWEQPGYGDISAARVLGGELEVAFADGSLARVPLPSLGIDGAFAVTVNVEDGLSIRLSSGEKVIEISWARVRLATDPAYARHRADLSADETKRLGRRLKALREDHDVSQAQLADGVGLSIAQLSRIEKGAEDVRLPTVKALLAKLGASFADIAGPEALDISVRTILAHADKAGVPRELGAELARAVPRRAVPSFLARTFGWSAEALLAGVPETAPLPAAVQFKASTAKRPADSPLVHLALSAARLARTAFAVPPYLPISANPAVVRVAAADPTGKVTLASLLDWTWGSGVAVLPLAGRGEFAAAVLEVDGGPAIVIKEASDLVAFWLFDLAHELGHLGRGHVQTALIDVQSPTGQTTSDAEEESATAFALELLLPNHAALIDEVRADARGSGVRFKFAVERAAARVGVSPGLLGIVTAFALPEVGRPQDRWGSATNLAKPEGSGREAVRLAAQGRARLDVLSELDSALIRTAVLREPR